MFIPLWIVIVVAVVVVLLAAWCRLLATGRNPLPVPDRGSRIFAAASRDARDALLPLLARHGLHERFRFDTGGVLRSILWDGTILNVSTDAVRRTLDGASSAIGLVSTDPVADATEAATHLRSQGFDARVVLDAEPDLPIAFVVTDAMPGTALNFRRHVLRLPRPQRPPRRTR